jgi:DNA-binding Lrp family transcriptional regulator
MRTDPIDEMILAKLADGPYSAAQIHAELRLSIIDVRKRCRRMIEAGLIGRRSRRRKAVK